MHLHIERYLKNTYNQEKFTDTIAMKFAEFILKKSETPAYSWVVFILTVCESVFLFVPPEVFMAPPIISNRRRAVPITVAATLGSIIGGAIAYMIGMWLFDSVGIWLVNNVSSPEQFQTAQNLFLRHGVLILFLTAVTPIPYKIISICAGFIGFPMWLFLSVTAIFRTTRFAIVAALLWRFQNRANEILKKYFWPITIGAIICAGLGIGLMLLM